MARTRTIRPDFWDDEKMATVSRDSRLTFIGLWNLSDDFGVVKGNHNWLQSNIYPYENIESEIFSSWIKELEKLKRIIPFKVNDESYYFIVKQPLRNPDTKVTTNKRFCQPLTKISLSLKHINNLLSKINCIIIQIIRVNNKITKLPKTT